MSDFETAICPYCKSDNVNTDYNDIINEINNVSYIRFNCKCNECNAEFKKEERVLRQSIEYYDNNGDTIHTLPDNNDLLNDIDIEGWYLTDRSNIYVEIIDPSCNDPEEGDWATNITIWQTVDIGGTVKLHENDGLLKDNFKDTSTWEELNDMIKDMGVNIIARCSVEKEEWLSELKCE